MAINKKGKRKLVFNGNIFYWYVAPDQQKGTVLFDFNPSCGCYFKTQSVDSTKIIITGDYHMNCKYDIGMENSFGLSEVPERDKPFGEFILVSDTLLKITYYYPKWVEKFNEHQNAPLFPSRLILDPRVFD